MNALDIIADAARSTGYREDAIVRDFAFPDVLDPGTPNRHVALAAFTRSPPSYRCAAFAAVSGDRSQTATLVAAYRALGAPLLFVIEPEALSVWQVRGGTPRTLHERMPLDQVPALFEAHRREWHPDAIHRAKSIGTVDQSHQLDFVDLGLLPAVEGEIHAKLDRLLLDMLQAAKRAHGDKALDAHVLFRVVFRLLAAKVLHDRGHSHANAWEADDPVSVLRGIESYYSLAPIPRRDRSVHGALSAAWETLREGISFSYLSAEDLAFVYENTLVTHDTRKRFGTHSTPRQLAEYAVARLDLHRMPLDKLRIYEPFAGAGVFLVSALRHVRDLLPVDWTDARRHDFLVARLAGDEIDAFACEVAALSLILADYPNCNGWRISQTDLFERGALKGRLGPSNVVLCNPPFEDFTNEERRRYGLSPTQYSQPVEVLDATLDARPQALAFVLPRGFILQRKFAQQRRQLEQRYRDLELVELPDRLFRASGFETSLVIAKEPRHRDARAATVLRSTVVSDRDRAAFLKAGRLTATREAERTFPGTSTGHLWIPALNKVWDYLAPLPRLGDFLDIHRGIEWQSGQQHAWATERISGYRRGLHTAQHSSQFLVPHAVWLDCRKERLRRNALDLPWEAPKLVTNSARLGRSAWRIGAAVDQDGLVCSQQYLALWLREADDTACLNAFAALVNGPLANAFLAVYSPEQRVRITALKRIPVPATLPSGTLDRLVEDYVELVRRETLISDGDEQLAKLLIEIDAAVLKAYDLPPRLERELLSFFPAAGRPVAHRWQHWHSSGAIAGLTLAERLSTRYQCDTPVTDVFAPLPPEEAAALRTYWP